MLRWEIASIIALLRKRRPVTPLASYIDAIEYLVDQSLSAAVTPIVLSPFVYGSRYSTANATRYTQALHKLRSQKPKMILVDCVKLLASIPKKKVLLSDGFHLSRSAHALIGHAIASPFVENHIRGAPTVHYTQSKHLRSECGFACFVNK
jgi:lysophospholipase L1-like esterase